MSSTVGGMEKSGNNDAAESKAQSPQGAWRGQTGKQESGKMGYLLYFLPALPSQEFLEC